MITIVKRASIAALVLIAGGVVVPHLASASATQTIVRCVLAQACASTKNTVGSGVQGITAGTTGLNAGVRGLDGSTNGGQNDGVLGTVTNGGFGVEGASGDGAYGGVRGTATTGFGLLGLSNSSYGVYGGSSTSYGVYGASDSSVGIIGASNTSVGVIGQSNSGDGGQFTTAATASSDATAIRATSVTGAALIASTGGSPGKSFGAFVTNTNPDGTAIGVSGGYYGLLAFASSTNSYPLAALDADQNFLFTVDGNGNVSIKGAYSTLAAARTGQETTGYSTRTTTSNVEDIGSAELVNGVASVTFDPAFAASIDLQTAYHVFLTPNGDTRGLYIASKTASGFVVRETQGGRSRLTFDYRIVALALGHARDRMAFVNPQSVRRLHVPALTIPPQSATRIPAMQLRAKRTLQKAL